MEDHIYEEIVYSQPGPTQPTSSTTTSAAKLKKSTSTWAINKLPGSKSLSKWFPVQTTSVKCSCCQSTIGPDDITPKIFFSKHLKCCHCNKMVCRSCFDAYRRCHECSVRLTTIFEPKDMLRMRTARLLDLIKSLHYEEKHFADVHKAYLVKQLLVRFNRHPDWDPTVYVQRHKEKSNENLCETDTRTHRHHHHHQHRHRHQQRNQPDETRVTWDPTVSQGHHSRQMSSRMVADNAKSFPMRKCVSHAQLNERNEAKTVRMSRDQRDWTSRQSATVLLPVVDDNRKFTEQKYHLLRTISVGNGLDNKSHNRNKPELKSFDEKRAIFETLYATRTTINAPPTFTHPLSPSKTSRERHRSRHEHLV